MEAKPEPAPIGREISLTRKLRWPENAPNLTGRYDDIGREFGRARPATGFSADLKTMLRVAGTAATAGGAARVFAPAIVDARLEATIAELRGRGQIVLRELPGQVGDAVAMGCSEQLVYAGGTWVIEPV